MADDLKPPIDSAEAEAPKNGAATVHPLRPPGPQHVVHDLARDYLQQQAIAAVETQRQGQQLAFNPLVTIRCQLIQMVMVRDPNATAEEVARRAAVLETYVVEGKAPA